MFATTTKICTKGSSTFGYPLASKLPLYQFSYLSNHIIITFNKKYNNFQFDSEVSVIYFSAIHFRGRFIRQVSCYTLLSGCRLPWPPSCCLNESTPFVGSFKYIFWHLNLYVWFIPHRHSCLPGLAHLRLASFKKFVQIKKQKIPLYPFKV